MILYSVNGITAIETRSDMPASDWTGNADHIIDETNPENEELIAKIKECLPYLEYVTDANGNLVDVIKTKDFVPEPIPEPVDHIAELQDEVRVLKAQNQALSESNQFLEDCLVEMAEIVYA